MAKAKNEDEVATLKKELAFLRKQVAALQEGHGEAFTEDDDYPAIKRKKESEEPPQEPSENAYQQALRQSVRCFYDFQKLRIQHKNRGGSKTAILRPDDHKFHERRAAWLKAGERAELRNTDKLCSEHIMYDWLRAQRGIGPTLCGAILSEIDIHRAGTASALWKYAGLAVKDGKAPRRTPGQKNDYNSFLRTKLVGVMADCFIKLNSPWVEFYANYKTRKQNTIVPVCMGCDGTGKAKKGIHKGETCPNCKGSGKNAPWGESDGHRHRAAIRYMVKMFLLALWKEWRTAEGLPTPDTYAEVYLGRKHGDHKGALAG